MNKMSETTDEEFDPGELANRWLRTGLGRSLLLAERRIVEAAVEDLFGEQCLQIGLWGDPGSFIRFARTQRALCLADTWGKPGKQPGVYGRLHRLPIASKSIDVVVLPHTLDFADDRSQAILREADRVLMPNGHLIVLGFKSGGLWGLRRLIPGAGLPPGLTGSISERRLSDWLELLDMRVLNISRYFFRWPIPGKASGISRRWEQRGQRFWPELAACYMLTAQKRVVTLTPIKKPWLQRAKVVGSIVEPTTRVSRIRFERNR